MNLNDFSWSHPPHSIENNFESHLVMKVVKETRIVHPQYVRSILRVDRALHINTF